MQSKRTEDVKRQSDIQNNNIIIILLLLLL